MHSSTHLPALHDDDLPSLCLPNTRSCQSERRAFPFCLRVHALAGRRNACANIAIAPSVHFCLFVVFVAVAMGESWEKVECAASGSSSSPSLVNRVRRTPFPLTHTEATHSLVPSGLFFPFTHYTRRDLSFQCHCLSATKPLKTRCIYTAIFFGRTTRHFSPLSLYMLVGASVLPLISTQTLYSLYKNHFDDCRSGTVH